MNSRTSAFLSVLVLAVWFGAISVDGQTADQQARESQSGTSIHISNFTSIAPFPQNSTFQFAVTHHFQHLVEEGDSHTNSNTVFLDQFDFTGFVPENGSSERGVLGINHETAPGGTSMMDISLDKELNLWTITNSEAIDFSVVGGTAKNCSGTITPWNSFVSCEELESNSDLNLDGYTDIGWCIEIDPVTRTIINQTGGINGPEKLWALGNFKHENLAINPNNSRTAYTGRDHATGYVFRFIADVAEDLSSGKLQVLKMNSATNGEWVTLNNSTLAERNSTVAQAAAAGATVYTGVEDIEISPDGMIYFADKGAGRVYRFRDDNPISGTTISQFETFVGGRSYNITHAGGVTETAWGLGNDNLAFDDLGNLWVNQDGGMNYIWMVEAGHTQAAPKVKLFGIAPSGAESTGITFTPDYQFMFLSMQHPDAANVSTAQRDVSGDAVAFDKDIAIVMARVETFFDYTSVEARAFSAETTTTPFPLFALLTALTALVIWKRLDSALE